MHNTKIKETSDSKKKRNRRSQKTCRNRKKTTAAGKTNDIPQNRSWLANVKVVAKTKGNKLKVGCRYNRKYWLRTTYRGMLFGSMFTFKQQN